MNDCRRAREELACGSAAAAAPREHLARCPKCAAFARDLERLRAAAATLPRPPVPPLALATRRPELRPAGQWLRAAAAGIALATSTAALLLCTGNARREMPPAGAGEPDLLECLRSAEQALSTDAVAVGHDLAVSELSEGPDLLGGDVAIWPATDAGDDIGEVDPTASLRPAALLAKAAIAGEQGQDAPRTRR